MAGDERAATMREGEAVPETRTAADKAAANERVLRQMRRRGGESRFWWLVPTRYIIFLMLPIYWLIHMSF